MRKFNGLASISQVLPTRSEDPRPAPDKPAKEPLAPMPEPKPPEPDPQ